MPTDTEILDKISKGDYQKTKSSDGGDVSDADILSSIDAGAAAQPESKPASMQAALDNVPPDSYHENLQSATGVISKYLAPIKEEKPAEDVTGVKAITNAVAHQATQPTDINVDNSRPVIKNEIEASQKFIGSFIDANPEVKKALSTAGYGEGQGVVDPDAGIKKVIDPNAPPEAMQAFSTIAINSLNKKHEKALADLEAQYPDGTHLGRVDDPYGNVEYTEAGYNAKKAAIDNNYAKEKQQISNAITSVAQLKVANQLMATKKPGAPITIDDYEKAGKMYRQAVGDNNAIDNENSYAGRNLETPEEKVQNAMLGARALQTKMFDAIGNGQDAVAQHLGPSINGYRDKILNANPEFKKSQIINALSDKIYDNEYDGTFWTKVVGEHPNQASIDKAAKDLGIPAADLQGIAPSDIKAPRTGLAGKFVGGLIGTTAAPIYEGVMKHIVAPAVDAVAGTDLGGAVSQRFDKDWYDNSAMAHYVGGGANVAASDLFKSGTHVDANAKSDDYLMNVPSPNAGKWNGDISNVLGVITKGMGEISGFASGIGTAGKVAEGAELAQAGSGTAGLLSKIGLGEKAAEKVGTAAYTYLTSYDNNKKDALQAIGNDPEDESKATWLANAYTAADILGMELLNPAKLKGQIFKTGTLSGDGLLNMIKDKGVDAVSKSDLKTFFVNGIKESVKDWSAMTGGAMLTQAGHSLADMMLAPKKFAAEDNVGGFTQSAVNAAIVNVIPSLLGGFSAAKHQGELVNGALWDIGSNPRRYIDGITDQVSGGVMDEATAQGHKANVEMITNIVNSVPEKNIQTDKFLTEDQKKAYAANLFQEQAINQKKANLNDKVQVDHLNDYVKDLHVKRQEILANAGTEPIVNPQTTSDGNSEEVNKEKGGTQEGGVQEESGTKGLHNNEEPVAETPVQQAPEGAIQKDEAPSIVEPAVTSPVAHNPFGEAAPEPNHFDKNAVADNPEPATSETAPVFEPPSIEIKNTDNAPVATADNNNDKTIENATEKSAEPTPESHQQGGIIEHQGAAPEGNAEAVQQADNSDSHIGSAEKEKVAEAAPPRAELPFGESAATEKAGFNKNDGRHTDELTYKQRIKRVSQSDPQTFGEAVLQWMLGGGKLSRADFERFTGFGGKEKNRIKRGGAEVKELSRRLTSKEGKDGGITADQFVSDHADKLNIQQADHFDKMQEMVNLVQAHPGNESILDRLEQLQGFKGEDKQIEERAKAESMMADHPDVLPHIHTEQQAIDFHEHEAADRIVNISSLSPEEKVAFFNDEPVQKKLENIEKGIDESHLTEDETGEVVKFINSFVKGGEVDWHSFGLKGEAYDALSDKVKSYLHGIYDEFIPFEANKDQPERLRNLEQKTLQHEQQGSEHPAGGELQTPPADEPGKGGIAGDSAPGSDAVPKEQDGQSGNTTAASPGGDGNSKPGKPVRTLEEVAAMSPVERYNHYNRLATEREAKIQRKMEADPHDVARYMASDDYKRDQAALASFKRNRRTAELEVNKSKGGRVSDKIEKFAKEQFKADAVYSAPGVSPGTFKAVFDLAAKLVRAGENLHLAIRKAIDSFRKDYSNDFDEKALRNELQGQLAPHTEQPEIVPQMEVPKNQQIAQDMVNKIKDGEMTLQEVMDHLHNSQLPAETKTKFADYITHHAERDENSNLREPEHSADFLDQYRLEASDESRRFISGETLNDIFGNKPEGNQDYTVSKLNTMLNDGENMLSMAQNHFGSDVMEWAPKLLEAAKDMSSEDGPKKAILIASMIGKLQEEKIANPEREGQINKVLQQTYDYWQNFIRNKSLSLNAARILRLYRDKNLADFFSDKIRTDGERRNKDAIIAAQDKKISDQQAKNGVKRDAEKVNKQEADKSKERAKREKKPVEDKREKIPENDYKRRAEQKLKEIKDKGALIEQIKEKLHKLPC